MPSILVCHSLNSSEWASEGATLQGDSYLGRWEQIGHESDLVRNAYLTSFKLAFLDWPEPSGGQLVLADLILRLCVEITGVVAFVELCFGLAEDAVDHATALDLGSGVDLLGPAHDALITLDVKECCRIVETAKGELAVPGPDCHVSDGIFAPPRSTRSLPTGAPAHPTGAWSPWRSG